MTVLITAAVLTLLTRLDMTLNVLVLVCVALAVLALNVPLRVRRGWARALNQLAAMTLYVYLAHQFVIHFLSSAPVAASGCRSRRVRASRLPLPR